VNKDGRSVGGGAREEKEGEDKTNKCDINSTSINSVKPPCHKNRPFLTISDRGKVE
jgi:hypothetical protein